METRANPQRQDDGMPLRQAARRLGISMDFAKTLVRDQRLACIAHSSGSRTHVTVLEKDLQDYIKRHRRPAIGER